MTDQLPVTEFPTKLNPLPAETRAETREARKGRKAFAANFGPFVRAMRDVMTAYHEARAQGVERADAAKGIEEVLRAHWPKQTTKFPPRCDDCDDLGWQELVCRLYVRCQRETCQRKGDDWQHRYVVACSCPVGDQHRAQPQVEADAVVAVGRTQKPKRGFTRFGQ
jgi:hypothetical protein